MNHELWELRQMQAMPLDVKVALTRERIRNWYNGWEGQVYVSFSGGKDSTVLKHMVDQMYDDVPSLFINTGLEYPEIQKFAAQQKNTISIRPQMQFNEVVKKYGYPIISKEVADATMRARKAYKENDLENWAVKKFEGKKVISGGRYDLTRWRRLLDAPFKISANCCNEIKKKPAAIYARQSKRKKITAMMASESLLRERAWVKHGCNAFESKTPSSMPMAFWTEQDVLYYIKREGLEICSVYGEIKHAQKNQLQGQIDLIDQIGYAEGDKLQCTGCQRTGCIFCMFGAHLEKEPNRFQRLKQTHPKQWAYCIGGGEMKDGLWQPNEKGLGLWFVLAYLGVKYE